MPGTFLASVNLQDNPTCRWEDRGPGCEATWWRWLEVHSGLQARAGDRETLGTAVSENPLEWGRPRGLREGGRGAEEGGPQLPAREECLISCSGQGNQKLDPSASSPGQGPGCGCKIGGLKELKTGIPTNSFANMFTAALVTKGRNNPSVPQQVSG